MLFKQNNNMQREKKVHITEGFPSYSGLRGHSDIFLQHRKGREGDSQAAPQKWLATPSNPSTLKACFCFPSTSNDDFKTGFTEVTVFKKPQQTKTLQEKRTNSPPAKSNKKTKHT